MRIPAFARACNEFGLRTEVPYPNCHVFVYDSRYKVGYRKGPIVACFSIKEVNSMSLEDLQGKLMSFLFIGG